MQGEPPAHRPYEIQKIPKKGINKMITKLNTYKNPRTVSHYGISNISHLRYLILFKEDSYFSTLFLALFLALFTIASSLGGVTHVEGNTFRDLENGIQGPPGTQVTYHNITQSCADKTGITNSSGQYNILDLYSGVSIINPDNNNVMNYDSKVVGNKLLFGSNAVLDIRAYNVMGQEIQCNFNIDDKANLTRASFAASNLSSGIYFYQVILKNGKHFSFKVLYDKDNIGGVNYKFDNRRGVLHTPVVFTHDNHVSKNKNACQGQEQGQEQNIIKNPNQKPGVCNTPLRTPTLPQRDAHTWDITYHSPDGKFFDSYAQETIENDQTGTTIVEFDHDLIIYEQVKDVKMTVFNGASYDIAGFNPRGPVSNVNVAVVNPDGEVVGNATSGADGEVTIRVPTNDSWGSNQEDIMYTIELRSDNFRDNSFEFPVSPRTSIADTLTYQWMRKNIEGDPQNSYAQIQDRLDQTMMPEAYEYVALDTLGERTVVNPELESYDANGMFRMIEGQASGTYKNDGRVFADDVMGRFPLKMHNLNSSQLNSLRKYFNKSAGIPFGELQGDNLGGMIEQVGYELGGETMNGEDYDIQEGHAQSGINWDTDGNNTTLWEATYNLPNGNTTGVQMGADINANGNAADVAHEMGNMWNAGVTTEPSFMNATAIPMTINDVISYQFMHDLKENIFLLGIHTGTCTEFGVNQVPERYYTVNTENTNK